MMSVSTEPAIVVMSVASLKETGLIDGGDTLAVRFGAPDGREIVLLIPWNVARELSDQLVTLKTATT